MKKIIATGLTLMLLTACNDEPATVTKEAGTVDHPKENTDSKESSGKKEMENHEDKSEPEKTEDVVQEPEYKINENNWSIEPIAGQNAKVVLLTIDDAPDKHALNMAEDLKAVNAPAIFFVNGHFLDTPEEKEVLKKIYDMGFMIGNHTYSHSSLPDLSPEEQKEEIVSVNELVESITGERPKFFRAPFGQNTDYSRQVAAEEKMALMNWTFGYDWNKEYQTKEAITDIMVNSPYLNNGANLLMHDRTWTSEALTDIVKGLREKGYETLDPTKIKTP
ncbi:polysaccharide deacetylase [[Bacillus] enclensis]|uniref:Peptidoglycan/xylan/chitin deacetylase, PgdA/CDA1 family n=1 Tax=[Bacillus] enclensis TaxID=1402860 RepID=A0A0V8HIP9_9BACI|nr:polysaccharide deacetylase family protein [[Bacillus] enclensis]KSU62365.1 polysaccharide deacetylase [[Bacillus] enclensis]SCC03382.1 Peptidoglycan/xylan/chitin deacetylase, PgdA/CDA1 family [[Bacillus] enclensis]